MNEALNNALLDLQDSLGEIDNWAKLLQDNQSAAGEVMKDASKTLQQLEALVLTIQAESDKVLKEFLEKTGKEIDEIEELLMQYRQLATVTAELVDYLRSVNFPARLDKIDSSVAAITQGTQNLSDKLDRHRDQLGDKIEKEAELIRLDISQLSASLANIRRRQAIFFSILLALIIILLGGLGYLIFI